MSPDWLRPLLRRITDAAASASGRVVGCSLDDIAALEQRYDIVLPEDYRAVLLALGRRADGFLDREEFEFYYDQLLDLTQKVRELVGRRSTLHRYPDLPMSAFVIRARYLEQFELILCSAGEKTPVHYFNTHNGAIVPVYSSVASWLETLCNDELPHA
jgi:hypothetical protein